MSCSGFGYVKQYPVNPGCTLSGNCCENNTGYFSCPVNASECCDGLTVQNWIGLPGATGSSGPFGKVVLDQCGAVLNFWSNGSADIDVTAGSANVNIETANILCGAGPPTAPPPAPSQGFAYFNDTNSSLSIWCAGGTGWNPVVGSTGYQGPQGATGSTGPVGPQGAAGTGDVTDIQSAGSGQTLVATPSKVGSVVQVQSISTHAVLTNPITITPSANNIQFDFVPTSLYVSSVNVTFVTSFGNVTQSYDLVFNQIGNLQYIEFNPSQIGIAGFTPAAISASAIFSIPVPAGFSTLTAGLAGSLACLTSASVAASTPIYGCNIWRLANVSGGNYTFDFYFPINMVSDGTIYRQLFMLTNN
jgi:hypothetical protein